MENKFYSNSFFSKVSWLHVPFPDRFFVHFFKLLCLFWNFQNHFKYSLETIGKSSREKYAQEPSQFVMTVMNTCHLIFWFNIWTICRRYIKVILHDSWPLYMEIQSCQKSKWKNFGKQVLFQFAFFLCVNVMQHWIHVI